MRVLQISYYPTTPAITGGQRRVEKLKTLLLQCGHKVSQVAICPKRSDARAGDLPLNGELNRWTFMLPHDFEMRITRAIELDTFFRARVKGTLRACKPDLIWLEHPFLWPLLRRIFGSIPVLYSSHNVEWRMKRDLLDKLGIFDARCVELIRENEEELSRNAAFVVCCSEDDETYFRTLNKNCVLLRNGAEIPSVKVVTAATAEITAKMPDFFSKPRFSFISSHHEPNWLGFVDLVLQPLLKLPSSRPLNFIIVGGVSELYREWQAKHSLPTSVEIVPLPSASEEAKNLAVLNSTVLLPITQGGGTNLKTAEAILSGSPIIGTSIAFRGFEKFKGTPTVQCVDSPEDFHRAILGASAREGACSENSLQLNGLRREVIPCGDAEEVSWHHILSKVTPKINAALDTCACEFA